MTQAFDPLAKAYDADFTDTEIGRLLRQRVHMRLLRHFAKGNRILELGCGTGEDALYLAQHGIHVTATDVSDEMLDITHTKTAHTGLVDVERVDLRELLSPPPNLLPSNAKAAITLDQKILQFDGAFSNFGAVNVLADWHPLSDWLAARVKPGGVVALGIMGRVCAWELLWHSAHLDFKTAGRRLSGKSTFHADASTKPIAIYYPTIGRIKRDFAPHFQIRRIQALGVFLPPSDVFGVIEKRPRLLKRLTTLEGRFADNSLAARFADHFWIEFERRNTAI